MDRDELAAVFYGEGPVPHPWATDCPLRFDTWLAFGQPSPAGPERRVELILAIREEHGVLRVLRHFDSLGMDDCQPIAAGSFVAARMTLAELVRAVLPMTNLSRIIRLAKNMGAMKIAAALAGHFDTSPPADPLQLERQHEISGHLKWFLNLLHTVVMASRPAPPHTKAPQPAVAQELINMLMAASLTEPSPTQPPTATTSDAFDRRQRFTITSVTTNRQASPAVVRSRTTIKADAAEKVFSVDCSSIGWAVLDSGIDAGHKAFQDWNTSGPEPTELGSRVVRALDFVGVWQRLHTAGVLVDNGQIDWPRALPYVEMLLPHHPPDPHPQSVPPVPYRVPVHEHGTHIAGILGGWWPRRGKSEFRGICPRIQLYDFRVLNDQGQGDEFSIVTALQAVRYINEQAGRLVIAGVNISISVPHDVAAHSTGWTPVCIECDRLTRSGVVVVAAAGNAGFIGVTQTVGADYRSISISDPGNAESVITVGSTHRSNPHRHGVSYFSGRGPTADGRLKPDLLAPGEDIDGPIPGGNIYPMHGTSQAAAHVSGAAAMLLARNRELLGRPERVKQILCETATDLARERNFQGHGLVDVLRAMQSV
ncbi:S8 family serine peptidase [Streptomyces sp. ISL-86]|uniref:S8 family serine peptidase n=1 Tax=Streptomyces sp. ISL-86 TaxID=2819187 RepID=UPI001BEC4274|nr:S8 family serine peptidase [Streptomyces sp. ISL-86]MBT2456849.1 S8 family serine peptidase [Streptomyces sp. ISL-86]